MLKLISLFFFVILLVSCHSGKFLSSEENSSDVADLIRQQDKPHTIGFDDKITVSIWNHDNVSLGSIFSIYSSHETFGKWVLVDDEGYAKLPKIGKIKLGGLTCAEAGELIKTILTESLVDPIVVVKVLNREVTVIGEVKTPGNFLIDKETTTLYEIIGKAEGFLQYSDTRNIQLIRENRVYVIDLSEQNQQALYRIKVKGKDLINIPARRGKNFDLSIKRIIPFASALTAIAVFSTLIK